jgi:hypothetical protein
VIGISQDLGLRPTNHPEEVVAINRGQPVGAQPIVRSSSAHRRSQEWRAAGVFRELWRRGLTEYDALKGINSTWLAADGAMTKAPLGGENQRAESDGSREAGHEAQHVDGGERRAHRAGRRRRQRHDVMLLQATLASIPVARPRLTRRKPQGVCYDKGYDITWVYRLLTDAGFTPHVCAPCARTSWRAGVARERAAGSSSARSPGSGRRAG